MNEYLMNRCLYCDSIENLETHHIIPICNGGDDRPNNLITLCRICHGKVPRSSQGDLTIKIKELVLEMENIGTPSNLISGAIVNHFRKSGHGDRIGYFVARRLDKKYKRGYKKKIPYA